MPFSIADPISGNQQIALFGLPDTTRRSRSGLIVPAVDDYWGGAEVMYLYAAGSIRQGGMCVVTPTAQTGGLRFEASEIPNTANLGRSVCFAMTSMTVGQWGWFMVSGMMPINCQASVAADTSFGVAAAGQGGANSAGKQILSARSILAAAATVVKAATGNVGSKVINVNGDAGWFIGAYLSGTGIAAATVIVDIDPSGTAVTINNALTTAWIGGNVTATYNNATVYYNVACFNRPFAQGRID